MTYLSLVILYLCIICRSFAGASYRDYDDSHEGYYDYYDGNFNPNLDNDHNYDQNDYGNVYDDSYRVKGYTNDYDYHHYLNNFNNDYDYNFYPNRYYRNGYKNNYYHRNTKSYMDSVDNYNYNNPPLNYDSLNPLTFGLHYDDYDYPDDSRENEMLGLSHKSENELWKLIYELEFNIQNKNRPKTAEEMFPILQRRKRGIRSSSSSRRSSSSRSSSSSSGSSSSSRRSSSESRWGGVFGSKKDSSRDSRAKPKQEDKQNKDQSKPSAPPMESAPVDKSSYPKGNYPQTNSNPPGSYPSSGYPSGNAPSGGYPHQPSPGYPHQPSSGYPNQPSPGYPHQPSPGYPNQPSSGYPNQPSPGYPHQPSPGYPNQPSPGYPHQPSPGYPNQPSLGYPHQPSPGYPNQPSPGYPNQPSSGFPRQPSPGYPNQPSGYPHYPSSGFPGTSHGPSFGPSFGGSYPKASKKEKVMKKVQQALQVYAMKKMYKKNKMGKFISPSGMGMGMAMGGFGGGGMHGFHSGGMHGMGGSMGSMKIGKKILGTIIKLQIAKYALQFGASAAKAYFEYKLGRRLEEHMIEKFIDRYHRQKTRNYYRQSRMYHKGKDFQVENITLGEDCARECKSAVPLTCFFSMHIHLYQYLSRACYKCPNSKSDCDKPECVVGSGRHKLSILANKQLPGPTIQVCEGDKVLLEVYNELPSSGVTIHFRGQTYSESPYMDGTIGVTQNMISPGELFAYSFKADVPGTHFWHANTGVMRSDGVSGPFIVKAKNEPLDNLYDYDLANETIMFSEDFVKSGEEELVDLNHKSGKLQVYSLLINGRGFKQDRLNPQDFQNKVYSRTEIKAKSRSRVRLISAVSSNCPVSFRVLGQEFSVIAIDGHPVSPKKTSVLLLYPSERFDIVLEGIDSGLYWMEIKGFLDCVNHTQYSVLEVKSLTDRKSSSVPENGWDFDKLDQRVIELPTESPFTAARKLNELTDGLVHCNTTDVICSRNFTSNLSLTPESKLANLTLYLSLTARPIHNEHLYSLIHYNIASMPVEERSFTTQINNLTLKLSHEPLLVNQRPLKSGVCSAAGVLRQSCVEDFCECVHLQEIPLNTLTDIVFINEGIGNSLEPQTMYLHGHNFWVISRNKDFIYSNESLDNSTSPYLDRLRVIVKDAEELLIKNNVNPIKMNSITVPAGGYAVIRFNATNPGFWLLESSSVFKSTAGMGMVIKVGEKKDLPLISKKYLKCSSGLHI